MKPHKHAELIKCWADGAEIEYRLGPHNYLAITGEPSWQKSLEYRVKNKHQSLIDAYDNGAVIEVADECSEWIITEHPKWYEDFEYRIKPEPKPNVVIEGFLETTLYINEMCNKPTIRATFDGETNELISVEKI